MTEQTTEYRKMDLRNTKDQIVADDADLRGSTFVNVDLSESKFQDVNLLNVSWEDVNLSGSKITNVNLTNVQISDVDLTGMKIDGVLVQEALEAYRKTQSAERKAHG